MLLTIVTGSFSADHQKPYGAHRHGHDWRVIARVPAGRHKDEPQRRLDEVLALLDHGFLDDVLDNPSNEGVAEFIGAQLGAARVEVWRVEKGREFGAEWSQ